MLSHIAASVFSLCYMEYVTRLDMKNLMFRSLRGGDYGFYVIDQNPHSSMYGTSKAEVVNRGGRLYLKCPPKPEYDSTNDREFCCWVLLNSQTTDNNFPRKDWSNIRIARTELYNSFLPDDPITVQIFGSTEYLIEGYVSAVHRPSFLLGFVACYYQDYHPKWTFAIPEEVRTKVINQESFGPTLYTMPLVEQRTNKGGYYYTTDVSVVSGSIPSIAFDFYLPNNEQGYDISPIDTVDRSKVISTENSIDFTAAINGGQYWTNWNSSVPTDYLPSLFRNTVTIESLEYYIYSSNSIIYNSTGYFENPISFPLDRLENVSISASIGASFHEIGSGTVIASGHFDDILLSINGVNYPFTFGFTFRPSRDTDLRYLIIPSVFGELIEYSYIDADIDQPNFGLPIE